ncbi:tetratricopeptide repeat protein [Rhodopirellula sp. MGV]|uniref:tetratricopeptide repeat protein n=1 Tax=Rhodopirellula sp. MGV TaxID=2023130 RepID=UPI000B9735A7|nr:hypothetical protein [Rhodopirellula sp. MGV]OYP34019.1 hypothetical protein CGZ80_16530 [Rhodopirellula sp. MGV]PNY38353.1 hypothetical protein C2E31_03320 [Rhodopirellula baltica]
MNIRLSSFCGIAFASMLLACHTASAQIDRVYTYDSTSASAGKVITVNKNGITLKAGGNDKTFLESDIRKVLFQGDPPELTRGRELALDGQYEQAIEELKPLNPDQIPRDMIQADLAYYRLLSRAKMALAGQYDRKAAKAEATAFGRNHGDSYHFFAVVKLLGDLELATNNFDGAVQMYGYLGRAPSAKTQIQARYLAGIAMLRKDDVPGAQKVFSEIVALEVNSSDALRLKILAKAGQAIATCKAGKPDDGIKAVEQLIAELNPTDIEMCAKIYNAQGQCYEAGGDIEGAILAYLHTHLMFSGASDAHAEALTHLVQLWPKVGRTERAAEARQELQQRYPGFAN